MFCACGLCLGFPFAKWSGGSGPRAQGQGRAGLVPSCSIDLRVWVGVELEPHSHKRAPHTLQIQLCSGLRVERGWVSACRDGGRLDTGASHPLACFAHTGCGWPCWHHSLIIGSSWEPAQRALVRIKVQVRDLHCQLLSGSYSGFDSLITLVPSYFFPGAGMGPRVWVF